MRRAGGLWRQRLQDKRPFLKSYRTTAFVTDRNQSGQLNTFRLREFVECRENNRPRYRAELFLQIAALRALKKPRVK
jgi:hypothetical protein